MTTKAAFEAMKEPDSCKCCGKRFIVGQSKNWLVWARLCDACVRLHPDARLAAMKEQLTTDPTAESRK